MRKLKVMVVDDSALIRMIVGDMISQHEDVYKRQSSYLVR